MMIYLHRSLLNFLTSCDKRLTENSGSGDCGAIEDNHECDRSELAVGRFSGSL